jgi:hypothetical protein
MHKKLIVGIAVVLIGFAANAQETMRFDGEAKKLAFIRQLISKTSPRFSALENVRKKCEPMLKDLIIGKNLKVIEPILVADSAADPRLDKWKQCEGKDYHDFDVIPERFFDRLDKLGAPPYRYYRIELDGNKKNGPEDVIYYNQPKDRNVLGETGYAWVDLNNCEIKGGYPATGEMSRRPHDKPNPIFLNTLVYYKKQLWAVDFADYHLDLCHGIAHGRMDTCGWDLQQKKLKSK